MKTREFIVKAIVVAMANICPLNIFGLPNLAPYQPAGWSDKIVVATNANTTTDSPSFSTSDSLYLNWAVINNGDVSTGSGFYTALYVDGVLKNFWTVNALNAGAYASATNYALGSLSAGMHTLTITNDWLGTITETTKADNGYTKTIVVNPPAQPNLTPYQPAGWSDKIVVSSSTGTTTNSPLITPSDTVYVDWAVINNGSAPTAARFYTALYVDGLLRTSWYTDPPLSTNNYAHVDDYSIGSFNAGLHTLMLIADSTGTITESNELDNTYTRQFTVSPPPQPNLTPYQAPGWSDKVVISTNAGAITDSPSPNTADTLYAAWAVVNNGTATVSNSFSTTLSVDGVLRNTWTNPPPLAPSSYVSITNFYIGSLGVGLHTVALATDTGSTVTESSESDNSYTKLLAILQAPPTVQTLAATSITDVSALLQAWIDPHLGAGYAWFDYGTTTNYGYSTAQQAFATAATNITFNLGGLTAETSYHCRAVAYNGGGTNRGPDMPFTTLGPQIRIDPLTLTFMVTSSGSRAAFVSSSPAATQSDVTDDLPALLPEEQKLLYPADITNGFAKGPTVAVTVNLSLPSNVRARTDFASAVSLKMLQTDVHTIQQSVLEGIPANHLKLRHRFANIAGFSAEVTAEGLKALQADPRVISIEPVYVLEPHLAQGIPLIHGMTYRSTYNGAGMAIAICDTGVDYTHPRLGGGGFPNRKVLGGYDFGDNDADPMPDSQAHGTCCAGIAAGDLGTVGDYIGGVAYNAKLYAVKMTAGTSGSTSTDTEVASWDWCVTHRNDNPNYPIMVMSTSFGGGRYYSPCDNELPSFAAAASNAVAAGITVLASSGNDGYCDSLASPACLSSVISVGAVYDASFGHYLPCVNAASCAPKTATSGGCATGYYADDVTAPDKVTSYANLANFVTLLAPANQCYTLDIVGADGESSGDYYDSFGGTSAACPYAAGAVACLQSAAKARTGSYLTPQQVEDILVSSGDPVTDTKVAITKPRVNLERAIQSLPDRSQTFRIYNDGAGRLTVTSITTDTNAPWIHFVPAVPFDILAAGYQDVSVVVETNLVPAGQTAIRLLVASNDADKSPYPGGVYVHTVHPAQIILNGMGLNNGIFHFVLNAPPGSNYVVQASTNLLSWWPIQTNTVPGAGSLLVTDPGMTNQSPRFYRVLMP